MSKLPNDYCLCAGVNCSIKDTCMRYTYKEPLEESRISWGHYHAFQLCDPQEKIKPYWISNEHKE